MKCKYCQAEIEQDAQFCTNCGKNLSMFDKCVKCGELLDSDTAFCPYCGTEQPRYEDAEESEERSSYMKIFIAILGVLLLGGLGYYFYSNSNTDISFKDILETNGELGKLVNTHGFEAGSNMAFHNYICKNIIVDDAFVRPNGKGLPIMINCQYHPSYVDFDITIYDISDFQKFKKEFLKYSKKTGDTYQFSWPDGTIVKDVRLWEENDQGGISWSENLYTE